jgi:Chaperone of endosialidase
MKKLIIFLVLMFPLRGLGGFVFAQIFANKSTNNSITLLPVGMTNKPLIPSSTNTALGENTLINASNPTNNTGVGYNTLSSIGSNFPNAFNGNNNTGVGTSALLSNAQGFDNVAFGNSTMAGSNGGVSNNSNTAFGRNVMYSIASGSNNTAFGESTLTNITTGNNNGAFGLLAMTLNQSSNNHVAFGFGSLQAHITNDNSTAVGSGSLSADQSGTNNVALGNSAMQSSISISANTAVGNGGMSGIKTGTANVAFGHTALQSNDGQNNTVAGFTVLDLNTTGSNNVTIGLNALHLNITGSGNVAIGSSAGINETGSNKLYIDNAITPFTALIPAIGGDFAANKVCIACNMTNTGVNDFITRSEAFQITGNAFKTLGSGLWIFPSDRRLKTKIVSLNADEMLSKINLMQGVNYELIANPEQGMQYGFIAQDLRKIFPTKVYENKVGYLSSSYGDYVPMFVEALKALNERVEKLEENKFDIKVVTTRVEEMEKFLNK